MKTLFLTLATLATLTTHAQATFKFEAGTSTASHAVVGMGFGYTYHNMLAEGNITTPVFDRSINNAAYFGINTGYMFHSSTWIITPLLGMNYRLISTDGKG